MFTRWRLRKGSKARRVLVVLYETNQSQNLNVGWTRSVGRLWLDDDTLIRGAYRAVRFLRRMGLVHTNRVRMISTSEVYIGPTQAGLDKARELATS